MKHLNKKEKVGWGCGSACRETTQQSQGPKVDRQHCAELGLVVHICNLRTLKVETRGWGV